VGEGNEGRGGGDEPAAPCGDISKYRVEICPVCPRQIQPRGKYIARGYGIRICVAQRAIFDSDEHGAGGGGGGPVISAGMTNLLEDLQC